MSPIFRPDAPPNVATGSDASIATWTFSGSGTTEVEESPFQKVGSVKPALVPGSCGRSLVYLLLDATKENHLVDHPFRLGSQRFLSYLTHMRVLTLAVTPTAHTQRPSRDTIYFYTASATAGNQSSIVPGETSHRERSGLTTTCGCLFGLVCTNKAHTRERRKRRELSACAPPFCRWWE